jgi:hypothetical protein
MRHLLITELLQAMKDCLRGLNEVKLVRRDDPDVVLLNEHLTEKIAEFEGQGSGQEHPYQRAA